MKKLYCGMDLHSRNTFIGIMDHTYKRVFQRRVHNDLDDILQTMEPYQKHLQGIAVESTYNWYWLVDGLMDAGYKVHLANPAAMQQFSGKKYTDDRHDAFWLAHLLALGILPEGYIYPKQDRPVRDLLRKRSFFVKHRTGHKLSLQSMIERNTSQKLRSEELVNLNVEDLEKLLGNEYLELSATSHLKIIGELNSLIKEIERCVLGVMKLRKPYYSLTTMPGVGKILAMTIMLEVGDIHRFPTVGNFSSYARCVPSARISNKKKKGEGNRKNGNKYLSWAFIEASHFARRYSERVNKYYQRKMSKTNKIVAARAVANKMARAAYYIIRDEVPFKEEGLYC